MIREGDRIKAGIVMIYENAQHGKRQATERNTAVVANILNLFGEA